MSPSLRALPSVERLVLACPASPVPRPLLVRWARAHLARWRSRLQGPPCPETPPASTDDIVADFGRSLVELENARLRPVLNGTGILVHTNLGRAPLSPAAADATASVGAGYCNLELDLGTGDRGPRARYLELALAALFDADAATVVNNCAAALVLILHRYARGERREVLVSRGELVQIGGGFRIPEILEASGARLREVGTTNQTGLDDYRAALGPATALVLRVHRSNFRMEGFVASPEAAALAGLAREHGIPFVEDLGSGAAVDLASLSPSLAEPLPGRALAAGADLVCFSGDKLLGGPQAGIIVGGADRIADLKKSPLFRAFRCDKLVLAALQATVESYLHAAARRDQGPPADLPLLAALQTPIPELRRRAEGLRDALAGAAFACDIVETVAEVGGGVCPGSGISSLALRIRPRDQTVQDFAARLRTGSRPVLGRIAQGALLIDLRTVLPHQDPALLEALR